LIVLEQGQAKVCRFTTEGQEIVLSVVDAPAAFGELALIDGAPRSASIIATTAVTLRFIDRAMFINLVEREPALSLALLRALAGMVRATNERLADLLALDVPARLAKWLLSHSVPQPDCDRGVAPFAISQSDLAAELGASRVSVNRALKRFEHLGAIKIERERILLLNTAQLQDLVR
jgi:CRP/FNR family cyclic AMP-dependent transcriptional regulator